MNSSELLSIQDANQTLIKIFLLIFLATGIVLAAIIAVVYFSEKSDSLEELMTQEKFHINFQKEDISKIFKNIYVDLMFLSNQNELMAWLQTRNPSDRELIHKEYLVLSRRKAVYDQIRFIDENGMEICRVNYNNGTPKAVPISQLQSKKNRYYFADTFKLKRQEIFVSPFDLNIENGVIEKPLKPVIRFGTPVFDPSGRKRGVVILNYLGSALIHTVKKRSDASDGNLMLVNTDGFWLIGLRPAHEWGFMIKERKDMRFQMFYPEIWETIASNDETQLLTKQGLFTSATLYPLAKGVKSSTGAAGAYEKSEKGINAREYYWKLISFVPPDVLQSQSRRLFIPLFSMGLLLFFLSSVPSYLIAQGIVRRKRYELDLVNLATYDQLTGLPNRFLFFDRLDQALRQASRYRRQFALLFLDLDGFKDVNDSMGHDAGDELLVQVAKRLVNAVRKADTVARLAGDEFTIILTDIQSPTDPELFAEKVLKELSAPFLIRNNEITITASIGIGLFTIGEETAETLLKKSDRAMYEAKKNGKNTYRVYTDGSSYREIH